MAIDIRKQSAGTISGGTLSVDVDHTEDTIALGDGTNLLILEDVAGQKCIPVAPHGGGDASASNQTSGSQKTQITDASSNIGEFDDVGGEKAFKVSVISSVASGSGGTSSDDQQAFVAGTSTLTPNGGVYDANESDVLTDGQMGIVGLTTKRHMKVSDSTAHALLTTIDTDTSAMAVDLAALEVLLTGIDADTDAIKTAVQIIDNAISGNEMQVDVLTSALPTGASTAANQSTIIGHVDGIEALLTTIDLDTSDIAVDTGDIATDTAALAACIDGISGTELQVDIITSALPTGASTSALQTSGNNLLSTIDADTSVLATNSNSIIASLTSNGTDSIDVNIIGGAGSGGTALTDDAAYAEGVASYTPIGGVYASSVDSVDDGDGGAFAMTANRQMHVYIKGSDVASGGTSMTDDAAFTPGTSSVTPIGAVYQSAPDSVNDGDVGTPRMSVDRIMLVDVDSSALPSGASTAANQTTIIGHVDGIESLLTTIDSDTSLLAACASGSELQVDVITSALPSGAATAANQSTIIGHVDGIEALLGTIDADTSALFGCVGGNELQVDIVGALPAGTNAIGKLAANTGVDIGDVDVTSMTCAAANAKVDVGLINGVTPLMGAGNTGTGSLRVTIATDQAALTNALSVTARGAAAHDAAVSGNPVRVAGRAMLANGTAVAEDDTADLATDNQGRALVTPHVPRNLVLQNNITLTTTTETTLLAAAASTFHDVTTFVITNSSATAVNASIRDTTAGTVRMVVAIAANGGAVINLQTVPMIQTTVNTNWTVQLSGAVSSVYVFGQAIKRIA